MKVYTFDTTLRDGTQGEGVSLSVNDKLLIAQKLDSIGIDYIEGGWPGSNPKDKQFFILARELKLKHARLTAFGSTRLAKNPVDEDPNLLALVEAGTPVVAIFGKSWELHVLRALGITLEENLKLISESVRHLKASRKEVIYDAEHFFDGYTANPAYALETLRSAKQAGADALCLCDTNGGTLPGRISEVVREVCRCLDGVIGVHTHNDSGLAIANSLAAVESGATMVQGCFNGYGEDAAPLFVRGYCQSGTEDGPHNDRSRQAPPAFPGFTLHRRGGKRGIAERQAVRRQERLRPQGWHPCKRGAQGARLYEHIKPEIVGNERRVLVSDLAGRANIVYRLKQQGMGDQLDDAARRRLLERIKTLEHEGYDLESADGSFELLVRTAINPERHLFDVESYEVAIKAGGDETPGTTATVTLRVNDRLHSATTDSHGPLDALYSSLRTCLREPYPRMPEVRLADYKVRVLDARQGTAAKVRVLTEWTNNAEKMVNDRSIG